MSGNNNNKAWDNGSNNQQQNDNGLHSNFSNLDLGNSSRLSSWVTDEDGERRSQTAPPGLGDMGAFAGMNNGFNNNQQGGGFNSWSGGNGNGGANNSGNGNFNQVPQYGGNFGGFHNNVPSNFGGNGNYNNGGGGQYNNNQYNQQHGNNGGGGGGGGYQQNMGGRNFNNQQQQQQNFNNQQMQQPPAPQSWNSNAPPNGGNRNNNGPPPQNNNGDAAAKRYQQLQEQAMRWMQQQMQSEGLGNVQLNNGGGKPNFNMGGQIDNGTKGPSDRNNSPINLQSDSNRDNNNGKPNSDTKATLSPQTKQNDNSKNNGGVRSFADIASSNDAGLDKPAQWPSIRSSNGLPHSVKNPPSKNNAQVPQTSPVATSRHSLQSDGNNSRRSGSNVSNTGSSNDNGRSRTEAKYYQVEFRAPRRDIFVGYDDHFKLGDLVKVEADRGEDLGTLIHTWTAEEFADWLSKQSGNSNRATSSKYHKRMLRLATDEEKEKLPRKQLEEEAALELCRSKAEQRKLPMVVVSAEYQFDRHKLTFYFEAERRIDFRELVRDLFAIYKTRIWLQQMSAVAMASAAPGAPRDTHSQRKSKKST
jgi:cell fate regulator YaaT (PSP1 superfamily)